MANSLDSSVTTQTSSRHAALEPYIKAKVDTLLYNKLQYSGYRLSIQRSQTKAQYLQNEGIIVHFMQWKEATNEMTGWADNGHAIAISI